MRRVNEKLHRRLTEGSSDRSNPDVDLSVGRIGLEAAMKHRRYRGGFGSCKRCKTPWNFVPSHSTSYTSRNGCFPLCEECWTDLATPEERLPFYRVLWEQWMFDSTVSSTRSALDIGDLQEAWPQIEAAVMAGG